MQASACDVKVADCGLIVISIYGFVVGECLHDPETHSVCFSQSFSSARHCTHKLSEQYIRFGFVQSLSDLHNGAISVVLGEL